MMLVRPQCMLLQILLLIVGYTTEIKSPEMDEVAANEN